MCVCVCVGGGGVGTQSLEDRDAQDWEVGTHRARGGGWGGERKG